MIIFGQKICHAMAEADHGTISSLTFTIAVLLIPPWPFFSRIAVIDGEVVAGDDVDEAVRHEDNVVTLTMKYSTIAAKPTIAETKSSAHEVKPSVAK
jgi:hypothetical protein